MKDLVDMWTPISGDLAPTDCASDARDSYSAQPLR